MDCVAEAAVESTAALDDAGGVAPDMDTDAEVVGGSESMADQKQEKNSSCLMSFKVISQYKSSFGLHAKGSLGNSCRGIEKKHTATKHRSGCSAVSACAKNIVAEFEFPALASSMHLRGMLSDSAQPRKVSFVTRLTFKQHLGGCGWGREYC